ncbi:hypothetical protein CLV30_1212 [Haloactinopolyspora alba]|uniref:Uncharacterized protein n=1 Tax=Haloactinopolyspora alba TaxID=648780 RepID=A0A2P8DKU6_9ACTN|nr:hypothetical protein [Haloactinopolyspora alba]PSK97846.1 hypothetical protein CLV30_1212 [Haloactinopolyspora alba]
MLGLSVAAFTVAWWLGLYLLGRDRTDPVMSRSGAGLLAYAAALVLEPFDTDWTVDPGAVLAGLPVLIWTGVLVALLPAEHPLRQGAELSWRRTVLPAGTVALVLASWLGGPWEVAATALVLVPLAAALVLLVRARSVTSGRDGIVVLVTLLFGLGVALLLMPLDWVPDGLVLAGIGLDLVVLGVVAAVTNALESGEALAADLRRSAMGAGFVAVVFGGQVGVVLAGVDDDAALRPLVFGIVATAVALVTLASPLQAMADRFVFAGTPRLRDERSELRAATDALPRRDEHHELAAMDETAFTRLVRDALRHYGDLGKLVSSPLTRLPAVDERLAARGGPEQSLDRAVELKAILLESIERLRPREQVFGTSDEWRHYNALYFPYVAGIRPYRRQPDLSSLDETSRRAFDWFRRYVPERTLYNWQHAAARLVAADIKVHTLRAVDGDG